MSKTVWYISKYVVPVYAARVGARGFLLLREFVRRGHRAVLITSDSNHLATPPQLLTSYFSESIDGVDVHWLRTLKYRKARSIGRILSWLDFEFRLWRFPKAALPRPDVIIVSSLSLLTILTGFWLRRRYRCKLVFEVRDIWPLVLVEAGNFSRLNPIIILLGCIERLGYTYADLIVGTMPNLGQRVADVTGKTLPVVCVPQGLDLDALHTPQELPREYMQKYVPKGKFIICYAGSVGANNAMETFVLCARRMQIRKDIHFLIVGEGYLKDELKQLAKGLDNITFAPGVPKAAVQTILACVDVTYFATHDSRLLRFGQSLNKVIDYMLAAKPVIASYSGYPSMINEADCGTFVPAEDVEALQAEVERYSSMPPEERALIGARGREWLLSNRTVGAVARDYLRHLKVE